MFFRKTKSTIDRINTFLDSIDQGILVFREGVKNYLEDDVDSFDKSLQKMIHLEATADSKLKKISNEFFEHSLMPQFNSDLVNLLENLDDIIDNAKENLYQFDVETPFIPKSLVSDFVRLTEVSTAAAETVVPAVRAFFESPSGVKDKEHRVYYYEKEADTLAADLKRRIFKEMDDLELSQKMHFRYFTLHIEQISDLAEKAARVLALLIIKTSD